jgi:AcrR family transcriptional regulator
VPGEGLRDRKKRQTRQQISDTATQLFVERGFDHVRVAEVASACGVSEKTVFNYFPTKESLLFDREEEIAAHLREALGRRTPETSPITAAFDVVAAELDLVVEHLGEDGADQRFVQRFADLVEDTPALRAAQRSMMERLVQVAAEAMAERAGVDPEGPEPQIAAAAIVALWRIQFQALRRYADGTRTPVELRRDILADVERAARLIDTGLWSFSVAVQGTSGRQQLKEAALAANEARKQVVSALKQARDAWRVAVADAHQHHHGEHGPPPDVRARHKEMHQQRREQRQAQKDGRPPRPRRPRPEA